MILPMSRKANSYNFKTQQLVLQFHTARMPLVKMFESPRQFCIRQHCQMIASLVCSQSAVKAN